MTCLPVYALPLRHMQSSVDTVIDRMDDYFLNREDWDTLVELGLGDYKDDIVLKKITAATKSALTRRYGLKFSNMCLF